MSELVTIVTDDLSKFGRIELDETCKLIRAYIENSELLGDKVQVFFNTHSGYVFLCDSDCSVAMINNEDKLELWVNCPECCAEGFLSDGFESNTYKCRECREWRPSQDEEEEEE